MNELTACIPWYAPGTGASQEEIHQQAHSFSSISFLQQLLDAVPDFYLIVNAQGQIVFANQALCGWLDLEGREGLYGQLTGNVLGCKHAFENSFGCGTREVCRTCGAAQAILSGLHGQRSVQECRITRRDDNALDLRVWASPLTVNEQAFSVFVLKDIGDEKRRQTLERIFFHDLLNLTSSLSLACYSLANTATFKSERATQLRRLIQQIMERLIDTIKSQRDLNRAESGELVPHVFPLSAMQLLQNMQAFYKNGDIVQEHTCTIQIAPDAQDVIFESDQMLLERVVGNMLKNAVEASGAGETVTLSCGATDDQVWFEVHNPAYMAREVQLQVFQRSFSTKGEGRGLGTYSIKLLTERYLNGRVTFKSSPTAGTVFRVSYPLVTAAAT